MAEFKARARTLDMLGRQQIAGIPTALHELFKNAHDAYADNVEVDFYRKSNILLLRDDGLGMTREDFESRWLTLGTESKLATSKTKAPPTAKNKKKREIMGEKGIGRLAIATIGPQVLILTRAIRDSKLSPVTVSFINWSMFELPDVDLNEIIIPVEEFTTVEEISSGDIKKLVEVVKDNLNHISDRTDNKLVKRIKNELADFSAEIAVKLLSLSYGPSLCTNGIGTHFIIAPVNEMLVSDIDDDVTRLKKGVATNLQRHLLGFSNTMQGNENVPIKTEFRDHKNNQVISLVGPEEFFTPEEYDIADHHIKGKFDSYGNFKGTLDTYHQGPQDIEFNLNLSGQKIACGPFEINFAYAQGNRRESQVPFDLFTALTNKLNSFGGIYVYKNGIRVLPYGNSDYDFLEIERRRTLQAAASFFSYRRMFGSISINSQNNEALQEKAGREGFQSNKAYRQFREYLMRFFEELATKHFTDDGVYAVDWLETKKALNAENLKAEKRKKTVNIRKKKFKSELDRFFSQVESEKIEQEFEKLCTEAEKQLNYLIDEFDIDEVASEIIDLETTTNEKLKGYLDSFVINKPRGVGLSKPLTKDWVAYQKNFEEHVTPSYQNARNKLDMIIGDVSKKAKIHLDMRARLQSSINSLREYSFKQVMDQRSNTKKALKSAEEYVNEQLNFARKELEETKSKLEKEIIAADFEQMDEMKFDNFRTSLENQLEASSTNLRDKLESIKNQLLSVPQDSDEATLSNDYAVAALETELEILKDDYASSLEMAQLGMAVSVIHHEFEANIKGVRNSIRELQQWANKNSVLNDLYINMRDGFDHLDNYLSLFTPLDRRLRKRRTKVTGEAVADFIKDLFGERFKRHDIELTVANGFREQSLSTFASVVYPVFVNVIDNAIYWLSKKDGVREITLGSTESGFFISDNGPGVSARDLPHIFDFGFSRKIDGRGMGLYIARTSLNKDDLDIKIDESFKTGTKFIIQPLED